MKVLEQMQSGTLRWHFLILIILILCLYPVMSIQFDVQAEEFQENSSGISNGQYMEDSMVSNSQSIIREIAFTIANQIEIYLDVHSDLTLEDLKNDKVFRSIVVQPLGQTSYTFLYDYDSMINLFDKHPSYEGMSLLHYKDNPGYEDWWEITEPTMHGKTDTEGRYLWKDPDGVFREKIKYTRIISNKTADGVGFALAVSVYVDEFAEPMFNAPQEGFIEQRAKSAAFEIAEDIEIYLLDKPNMSINDLKEDIIFRDIATSRIDDIGYVTVMNSGTGTFLFHYRDRFEDQNKEILEEYSPGALEIIENIIGDICSDSSGYYKLLEENGELKNKYVYNRCVNVKTADNISLFVAASVYIDGLPIDDFVLDNEHELLQKRLLFSLTIFGGLLLGLLILIHFGIIPIEKNISRMFIVIFFLVIILLFLFGLSRITSHMKEVAVNERIRLNQNLLKMDSAFIKMELDLLRDEIKESAYTDSHTIDMYMEEICSKMSYVCHSVYWRNDTSKELITYLDMGDKIIKTQLIKENVLNKNADADFDVSDGYETGYGFFGVNIDVPFLLYGKKEGNVGCIIDVRNNSGLMFEVPGYFANDYYVIDSNDAVIFSQNPRYIGRELEQVLEEERRGLGLDNFLYDEHDIEGFDWKVVINENKKDIFIDMDRDIQIQTIGVFIIVLFMIVLGIVLNQLITKMLKNEIKKKTDQLVEFNDHLEKIIVERTKEVNMKSKELEQMNLNLEKKVKSATKELEIRLEKEEKATKAMIFILERAKRTNTELKKTKQEIEQKNEELAAQSEELESANEELLKIQKELENEKRQVERKVLIRTHELALEKEKVEKLLKAKIDFMNQLSHDLRTPLTPIITLLPIVYEKIKSIKIDKDIIKDIEVSLRNAKYLQNLINESLGLARLESGSIKLDIKRLDLGIIIKEIIENYDPVLKKKGVKVHDGFKRRKVYCYADELRIKEVINNLLSNAVKASNDKGRIWFEYKKEKDNLIVMVRDEGIGLSEEQMKRIFDDFYKVDASRHDMGSTGLGLPICKKIMALHGGKIWAESKGLNHGTTFFFNLTYKKKQKEK